METKGPNAQNDAQNHVFHAPDTRTWAGGAPGAPTDAQQLQQELETQLRALGVTLSDGLRSGFAGRGAQLGENARGFGYAVLDAVNFGLARGREAIDAAQSQAAAGAPYAAVANPWAPRPKNVLQGRANVRFGIGLAQTIVGGIFTFSFLLSGLICMGASFSQPGEFQMLITTGSCLTAAGLVMLALLFSGIRSLCAAGRLRSYAGAVGTAEQTTFAALAAAVQQTPAAVEKDLRGMIRRGWITAWLDAAGGTVCFTPQAYQALSERRAQQEAAAAESAAAPSDGAQVTLAGVENFITVLDSEKQMMADDPQAVQELAEMQQTSRAILDWARSHPECLPKARKLASYYLPTTLKLLHTYNEVKAQGGENAENIRRDIAGMLHTLNTALHNLHDSLLSDVAMDVSTEISALQGMLAADGLSGTDFTPDSKS